MDEDTRIAVGSRTRMHPGDHVAVCAECGGPVHFHDVTPLTVPTKLCFECWAAWAQRRPPGEPFQIIVTPENVALLRGTLARDPTGGDPQ